MNLETVERTVDSMEDREALPLLSSLLNKRLALMEEEERLKFVVELFGERADEKTAGMVHR